MNDLMVVSMAALLASLYGYWCRTVQAKRPGSGRFAITPWLGVVIAVAALGLQLVGGTALAAASVKSVTTATSPSTRGYDVGLRPATFRDSMAPHALAPRREERVQVVAASAVDATDVAANSVRTFTSVDTHVADAANAIERAMPGRVAGVNVDVPMANGLTREVDIDLGDLLVQVKGENARGLTGQLMATTLSTGRTAIGYAPTIPDAAWLNAARQGIPIARTPDELLAIIRELG